MTKIKTLLLALTLAVTPALAQDTKTVTYDRASFQSACVAQAPESVDKRVVAAVCECATQYVSAVKNDDDRFAPFTIADNDPLLGEAVPMCIELGQIVGPDEFFKAFEQTKVGASGR